MGTRRHRRERRRGKSISSGIVGAVSCYCLGSNKEFRVCTTYVNEPAHYLPGFLYVFFHHQIENIWVIGLHKTEQAIVSCTGIHTEVVSNADIMSKTRRHSQSEIPWEQKKFPVSVLWCSCMLNSSNGLTIPVHCNEPKSLMNSKPWFYDMQNSCTSVPYDASVVELSIHITSLTATLTALLVGIPRQFTPPSTPTFSD